MNFDSLDWDNLEDWQKIGVGALALFLVMLVFYFFLLKPHIQRLKKSRLDMQQNEMNLKKLESDVQSLGQDDIKFKSEQARSEELAKAIYREEQIPKAISDLTARAARGLSINFSLIEPGKLEVRDRFKVSLINIKFSCGYVDMLSYFARISEVDSFRPVEVSISPNPLQPQLVEVDLSGQLYLLPNIESPGVTAEKTAAPAEEAGNNLLNPFMVPGGEEKGPVVATESSAPDLQLSGIWSGAVTKAIINGKIVKVGDKIEGCTVRKIDQNQVVLIWNGQEIVLAKK